MEEKIEIKEMSFLGKITVYIFINPLSNNLAYLRGELFLVGYQFLDLCCRKMRAALEFL